jgi:hypothetical protein
MRCTSSTAALLGRWYETPSVDAYYLAGLIKLGGAQVLTLKLASVVPGILAVAAMYPADSAAGAQQNQRDREATPGQRHLA